jgi:uncharacterized membrane protein YdjX (TVP38/TMEM64 family)
VAPPDSSSTSGRNGKIAAIVAVAAVLLVAYELGVFEQARDPAALGKSLVAMGAWGYVAFIVTYAAVQPFGVPGTIFVFCAALIWPWPIAFALSMIGTMAASIVGFSFARFVARDWISRRIPEQFKKYDEALARRALVTVIVMRFIFWMPPLLHAFFGVSKVRFWTHVWGSLIGYVVPLFLMSYFGQKLWDVMKAMPASIWIEIGIGLLAAVLGALAWRRSKINRSVDRA